MATFLITYYFCHTNDFAVLSHIQNRTLKVYLLVIPGHITISCVTLPKWLSFPIIKNYIDWHLSKHCLCVSWAEQLSVSRHIHVFKLFLLRKKPVLIKWKLIHCSASRFCVKRMHDKKLQYLTMWRSLKRHFVWSYLLQLKNVTQSAIPVLKTEIAQLLETNCDFV